MILRALLAALALAALGPLTAAARVPEAADIGVEDAGPGTPAAAASSSSGAPRPAPEAARPAPAVQPAAAPAAESAAPAAAPAAAAEVDPAAAPAPAPASATAGAPAAVPAVAPASRNPDALGFGASAAPPSAAPVEALSFGEVLPAAARSRPPPRPVAAPEPRASSSGSLVTLRPKPRPAAHVRARNPAARVAVVQAVSAAAVLRSPRPEARPENHKRRAVVRAAAMVPAQPSPAIVTGRKGALCGDPAIQGETIAPIAGRIKGCGLPDGVKVRAVDGIPLSTPATIDCTTAKALRRWVSETVKPTVGRLGGGVQSLQVFAHYACRGRNNQKGAKISEHGRGRAIDIGAINLRNGASISVLDHWRDGQLGPLLKSMHRGACGPFGTVLGPQSDRFHQNHFHLDTARYRSGSYCR